MVTGTIKDSSQEQAEGLQVSCISTVKLARSIAESGGIRLPGPNTNQKRFTAKRAAEPNFSPHCAFSLKTITFSALLLMKA